MFMSVCLYVCMSVCLYAYMSTCLYVYMSICLYVYMSICLYNMSRSLVTVSQPMCIVENERVGVQNCTKSHIDII